VGTIRVQDSPFYGSTSKPGARLEYTRAECQKCGSSLAGRSEGLRKWGDKLSVSSPARAAGADV
jgi:hypothetical protein